MITMPEIGDNTADPTTLPTGTEIHYHTLCPRKLWWFSHGIEQEHVAGNIGAENVAMGTLLHQDSYPGERRKEAMIDGRLRIDFTDQGVVHEVKKSRGGERGTRMQVLYYLWYLKHQKGVETTGVIHYPKEKRTSPVVLTPQAEQEVECAIAGVGETKRRESPPEIGAPMTICAKCAYQDLCWG